MLKRYTSVYLDLALLGGAVLSACLAGAAAVVTGALISGGIGLLAVWPLLMVLAERDREMRVGLVASIGALCLLAFVQLAGLVPPPLVDLNTALGWASFVLLAGLLILVLHQNFGTFYHENVDQIGSTSLSSEPDWGGSDSLPEAGSVLMVWLTPLGRVRNFSGDKDLLSDLRLGVLADSLLVDGEGKALQEGVQLLAAGESVMVRIIENETGRLFILVGIDDDTPDLRADRLEEKLRQRTEFFAGLGHDLRSPLNGVIGFAQMMESEVYGPLPDAYGEYPGLIRESGEALLRLVDDMLAYARSEAGRFEISVEPMDLTSSAGEVMRSFEAVAQREKIKLVMEAEGEVIALADPTAVRRVWDNLVSNAIKYSTEDSEVVLATRQSGDFVSLSVSDSGAGMSAEDLARVTAPFEQGSNSRGRAGTGLGLAMVKRLSEMHGGETIIRSAPDQGTLVTVSFPAVPLQSSEAAE